MPIPTLELTVKQVADLLGISPGTVYRRIASGAYKTMPDPNRRHIVRLPADQFYTNLDTRVQKICESIRAL